MDQKSNHAKEIKGKNDACTESGLPKVGLTSLLDLWIVFVF